MIDPDEYLLLPTVREVLALPEVAAGEPTVIAGSAGLDRAVRWVHVAAGEGVAPLLDGGELILTTGAGWPKDPAALATVFSGLLDAGIAAIIFEVGTRLSTVPQLLVDSCAARGVPLIVLASEVRFVQITQRVHRLILAGQSEALQARATVHTMLTELGLNRSPVDYVIEQLAAAIGAPVVLENSAHDVIAWSSPVLGDDPEAVLAAWAPGRGAQVAEGWEQVPVEARGARWGALTALPGPAHPAGRRTVLELGAFALALGRLADTDADQWVRFSSKQLVDRLLAGKYRRDTEIAVQLAAGGLPVENRILVGVTLRGTGDFGSHGSLERAVLETALRRAIAPEGRALIAADDEVGSGVAGSGATDSEAAPVLLALLSFPLDDSRIDPAADQGTTPPLATRLARELEMLLPTTVPPAWSAHLALGMPDRGVRGLVTSLERVRAAGRLQAAARAGRVTVQQASRQPLAYLIRSFSGSPALQGFITETLGPVLEHDRERGGDLVRVLEAYTEHPTNRSLAAQQSRMSRSVFYQRIALIEELLGIDLTDGTTIATLAVALIAAKKR